MFVIIVANLNNFKFFWSELISISVSPRTVLAIQLERLKSQRNL